MAFNVFQRKDGRFAVKYKDEQTGKWLQKTFKSKEEAEELALQLEEDQLKNSRMTVAEVILAYVQNHPELCQKKKNMYEKLVTDNGYASTLANKYVDELNRRDLELVRNRCRENKLLPQSINIHVGLLSASFNWATEQELISDNPWKKYKPLKVTERASRKASLEDFSKVYNILPEYMQWACRTCLALCLRPGKELVNLKWEHFNWKRGCVSVYMPKVKQTKKVFPPQAYLAEAEERARTATCPYVITGARGKKVVYQVIKEVWETTRKKVKVSAPMYCMRHLAASLSLEAGGNLVAVARQLGHSDPRTTEQFYLHSSEDGQRKAGQSLSLPYDTIFGKKW